MIDLKEVSHNDRELELMLQKQKPLAMFYAEASELPNEELIPESKFEPHLSDQTFIRSELIVPGPDCPKTQTETQLKYVLFALRGEAWRIEAMALLIEQHSRTGEWNETCERMECFLLGYNEEETNAWCANKSFTYAP